MDVSLQVAISMIRTLAETESSCQNEWNRAGVMGRIKHGYLKERVAVWNELSSKWDRCLEGMNRQQHDDVCKKNSVVPSCVST
jgi:hypothetical protein